MLLFIDRMSKKLWDKGLTVNARMQELCVGDDPVVDRRLARADAIGSAAHARMLAKNGLLAEKDLEALLIELGRIAVEGSEMTFDISPELEDVHTAIEGRLTKVCGDAGKRIHTGRSRNDQVLLALRIQMRAELLSLVQGVLGLGAVVEKSFDRHGTLGMPGYTHLQPAMPSTVGHWLHALYEALLESVSSAQALLARIDSSPLGAGAGFGSSLPLDRGFVAKLLGFSRVQRSSGDVMNSRGRYELALARWCEEVAGIVEKFACDCAFFLTREAGFFSLDETLCTGSSIMPQKRNPDLVELLRARAAKVRGAAAELAALTAKMPSSYHRDFQYSKEPMFRAVDHTRHMIEMAAMVLNGLTPNVERLKGALYDELYATYDANRMVVAGMPFREAYRAAALRLREGALRAGDFSEESSAFLSEVAQGFEQARKELALHAGRIQAEISRIEALEANLLNTNK